ncbi:MAG: phosphatidylglycerophosphatase A family protein [Candidatus Rokuibacteriota bacterium]
MTRLALLIATAGGAGWAPLAPGTVGSALTALGLWLAPPSRTGRAVFLVTVTALGIWAADRVERTLGRKDPGAIVIDEVAGMTLAVLPFPSTWPVLAAGFVLFRIFDIWKPFPANDAQRLSGGLGVMADDLVAGLYALLVLAVLRAGLGWA